MLSCDSKHLNRFYFVKTKNYEVSTNLNMYISLNKNNVLKPLFIIIALIMSKFCVSQNYKIPEGDFMDTTLSKFTSTCQDKNVLYYQIGAKYPESSLSILKNAQAYTSKYNNFSGNGYITFRFIIDCKGEITPRIQVLQTDENYKKYYFEKDFVNLLYAFLKTMDKWKIARINNREVPLAYHSFITFKIQDGKVVNILP